MACIANSARRLCMKIKNPVKVWPMLSERHISTTSPLYLRKIKETVDGNTVIVEGERVKSERADHVIPTDKAEGGCTLCGFDVKYTDVLIVSQFVTDTGQILPRWVTGLCLYQQTKMIKNLHKAQRAGLMPNLRPKLRDGKERTSRMSNFKWKKYNVYYENEDKVFAGSY